MTKWLKCKKESEDDKCVIYRYTDIAFSKKLTGSFRIAKNEGFQVSTICLPEYTKARADEMKLAGKLIIEYQETGVWAEETRISQ